jgi:hypothetical protein
MQVLIKFFLCLIMTISIVMMQLCFPANAENIPESCISSSNLKVTVLSISQLGLVHHARMHRIEHSKHKQEKTQSRDQDPSSRRRNEVTTLTNVSPDISASNALSEYNVDSAFSGIYHPPTKQWMALASEGASLKTAQPISTVAQFGGHAQVERALVTKTGLVNVRENVAFVLILENANTLRIKWNSISVNQRNFGDRAAPRHYRAIIMEAIRNETGYRVIE